MKQDEGTKKTISKKILRIALRILAIFVALYLLAMTGISIYVSSSKDKLLGLINSKMNNAVLGDLKVGNTEITVWRSFPDIGIRLENISLKDSLYHKPFLQAEDITIKTGLLDLIGNKLKISSVDVENAFIHSFTTEDGYSNAYVIQPKVTTKKQNKKAVVFGKLNLNNVSVILENAIKQKRFAGMIKDGKIGMRLSGTNYHISFDEDILLQGLGFNLPKGYWLENQRIEAKWKLEFETTNKVLTISETKVKIQGQPFTIKGKFEMGEKSQFHLEASTKGINYDSALNILKPNTRNKLSKVNLSGPVDADVILNGVLNKRGDPFVKVNFQTTQNNINTPVLNLSDCKFTGEYFNQVNTEIAPNDSNSRITITGFTSSWGEIQMDAPKIIISNLIKPIIEFQFSTQCTLPQLDNALGSETFGFTKGNAKLSFAYNGPLIPDPSLLNRVNASIAIEDGTIFYAPRNITFSACSGDINIADNMLSVNNLQCNVNTTHFIVNVKGQDINSYAGNGDSKATISCDVESPAINLNDFKSFFAKKGQVKAKKKKAGIGTVLNSLDNTLEKSNLAVTLKSQQVTLNQFLANNVNASLLFGSNGWSIKQASLQHADGSFSISGIMRPVGNNYHETNLQASLNHINVKKLFHAFDNFGQKSITAANLQGVMDAKANISIGISNAGTLINKSMDGKIFFSLKNAALYNFKPLLNIQKYAFKNRDLNNVQFAELKDTFEIRKGEIYIKRMPVQSSALTMYVEGVYSTEGNTDLLIQIPVSSLANTPDNNDFKKIDKDKLAHPGTSINLRARDGDDGQIKISLDLFNKYKKEKQKKEKEKQQ
ncbi:MAG: hypothetical protein JST21_02585 [Bacteroidetes bacterium]|nr:hypothetical protein [Bacteroidota bacterium]